MTPVLDRLRLAVKALRQLGPRQAGLFAWYQLQLRSGYLRRATPPAAPGVDQYAPQSFEPVLPALPGPDALRQILGPDGAAALLAEADEIAAGQVRLFGGPPVPLELEPPSPLLHWTALEKGGLGAAAGPQQDIKFTWEPARFGWAFTLGRAYRLSGDERYPEAFWRLAERFLQANPPNQGPHWASAQEVALRLLAFAFVLQVFQPSPHSTPERVARLLAAIQVHARRIPPSLAYARAQHNNHLLTEAAGLLTAGLLLPESRETRRWRQLGRRWLHRGLLAQIDPDGAYAQHSANYHRLMLHTALWANALLGGPVRRPGSGLPAGFPPAVRTRLAAATRWLLALLDPPSGQVPNLGPNDGACILPLDACSFSDYRPVLQAAGLAFLNQRLFPPGPWDELPAWLGLELQSAAAPAYQPVPGAAPPTLRPAGEAWAYLRVQRFRSRPGHADPLHLDLWWRGLNLARDAGTYLYNAPPPWQNALSAAAVHNTLTLNGEEPMRRATRFLYLDWAQSTLLDRQRDPDGAWERLAAQHDGYRRLGALHRRTVTGRADGCWQVDDEVLPAGAAPTQVYTARLHWLLPGWPWELDGSRLRLRSPFGWVAVAVSSENSENPLQVQLARAGEVLEGAGPVPAYQGWYSPTFGVKEPALSFAVTVSGRLPLRLSTRWQLPEGGCDPS